MSFIVLKHCIICIFVIHSGRVQKMLTALLQKTTGTNFFGYKGKMYLNIEKFLVNASEEQP